MLKIGIIGIRGYDVIYSGFETFVKYLVKQSNKDKFYFYLFCRNIYQKENKSSKNFSTVIVHSMSNKYLETPYYSLISNLISLYKNIDIILYLGLVNSFFILIQKLAGRKVIVNTDGLDWQRKRWSFWGKLYLKFCEKLTVIFADIIICDSLTVYQYFLKRYKLKNLAYIPYGAEVKIREHGNTLTKFGLYPNKYIHFVGRLTPENKIEDLINAFKQINTCFKCVIVGDSVYESKYKKYLLDLAENDKRIIFTGFLKGKDYEEICSNSHLYVETKEVGGTHPSLLEAMAFKIPVIVKKIPYHEELLLDKAVYYSNQDSLQKILKNLLDDVKIYKKYYSKINRYYKIALSNIYNWKIVISKYEELVG